MGRDACQHVGEVLDGVDVVAFAAFNQRIQDRGALSSGVVADEQIILPAQYHRPHRVLGDVVVGFEMEYWQDLSPDHSRAIKQYIGLSDDDIAPLYKALERSRASATAIANLKGLLTQEEALHFAALLGINSTQGWPFTR